MSLYHLLISFRIILGTVGRKCRIYFIFLRVKKWNQYIRRTVINAFCNVFNVFCDYAVIQIFWLEQSEKV